MKTLKFRPHLVKLILSGEKTLTWRLFDDKDLQVGDEVELINWETGEVFSKARLTKVVEKKLGDVEPVDYEGHEKFKNEEEMLATYKEYYGDRVDLNSPLKVISFELF